MADKVGKPQSNLVGYDKPLPKEPKSVFTRFKIFITKKLKLKLPKISISLFTDVKREIKKIQERKITKQAQENKIVQNTETRQSLNNEIDPYQPEDLNEIYGELPSLKNKPPKTSTALTTETSEEGIYMNLQEIQKQKKEQPVENIGSYIKSLGSCLQAGNHQNTEKSSEETKAWFQDLNKKSKNFTEVEVVQANNKYTNIDCPIHSSATKHNIYHANKITLGENSYIAAQGPYKKTGIDITGDFIAMIAENDSPISISLVKDSEFGRTKNTKLPPQQIGETLNIPSKIENGKTIREATTITMINSIKDDDNSLQVDVLSINGKQHVRIYDLTWQDHTGGDPERLAAISLFAESISNLPELKDRKDKPTIINCNAGVGRTGTAILVDHIRKGIEQGKTPSESQLERDILHIRNDRPTLVQQDVQLETLKTFTTQGNDFVRNMEGYFKF